MEVTYPNSFIPKEMTFTGRSRGAGAPVRGCLVPLRDAWAGSFPGTPKGAPTPVGPMGSPGAIAGLLEQRLPEERRFLASKGLGTRAVWDASWKAEVICWEMLRFTGASLCPGCN